ncbi:MAG TPA: transposase, partial [Thermoguttaceae bacterium]|nr:transposase [Thermoguttaceae bacterium]
MPDYRRWYLPGGTFFFTLVCYGRRPLFGDPSVCALLGDVMRELRDELPFESIAACLLPDHLHAIWQLPAGDSDYSGRWKEIKSRFTERWLAGGGTELPVSESRRKRGERGVWQRRFWEHTIQDESDLEIRFDYVHYNPVKHGYVRRPWDWEHSTFRHYVAI